MGDMGEELEDDDVVVVEHLLELDDVFDVLLEFVGGDELVDAGNEDVLVVGAVEYLDDSAGRALGVGAPEKVGRGLGVDAPEKGVTEFEGCGLLEGGDVATLGIYAVEDVADGSVFTGGVHALKDDEHRFLLGGVEDLLELCKLVAVLCENI